MELWLFDYHPVPDKLSHLYAAIVPTEQLIPAGFLSVRGACAVDLQWEAAGYGFFSSRIWEFDLADNTGLS